MTIRAQFENFIDGCFVAPESSQYLDSINPADQSVTTRIADSNEEDVNKAVESAKAAVNDWSDMRPLERGKILIEVGKALDAYKQELAELESAEMGVPAGGAIGTMETAANYYRYYGGLAPSVHGDNIQVGPAQHSYTICEPYGVVGAITPWNAPLNQAARSISPALAVGNTVVHKPSEYTSATALRFAEIAVGAGLPAGVLNVVTGYGNSVGTPLVQHADVAKVSFTGSVFTGQKIGGMAAEKIMPVTLELGGKSPNIIFEDADLASAIQGAAFAFLANSGQICLAGWNSHTRAAKHLRQSM